jgi:hypothetical protein
LLSISRLHINIQKIRKGKNQKKSKKGNNFLKKVDFFLKKNINGENIKNTQKIIKNWLGTIKIYKVGKINSLI